MRMIVQHNERARILRTRAVLTTAFAILVAVIAAAAARTGATSLGPISARINVPTDLPSALAAHDWTSDQVLYRILRQTFPSATYILPDEHTISTASLRRLAAAGDIIIDPSVALPLPLHRDTVTARYAASTNGPLELRGITTGTDANVIVDRGEHPGAKGQRVVIGRSGDGLVIIQERTP